MLWNSQESIRSCRDLDRALGTGTSIYHRLWQGAATMLRLFLWSLPVLQGAQSAH